ncbi:integrase [Gossypium australe]|uniref:Integrase n=1 Tax=Gossypium australe TaxID=47621 RepID=A0A5B6UTB9_9ROSI|nr:integrase [Gossypium australe]
MKRKIVEFVAKCLVKAKYQVPSGLLQPIMIPEWKWERVVMNFVSGLLMKSVHFISARTDYSLEKLAKLYVSEIDGLHKYSVSFTDRWPVKRGNIDSGRHVMVLHSQV